MKRSPLKEIKELQNEIMRRPMMGIDMNKIKSFSQFQIVKHLLDKNELGEVVFQKDLESILNIRKSTLSGILDTMEKNKIINRVPSSDYKGNIISLEPSVADYHRELLNTILSLEQKIIRDIPESDMEAFYRVIDRIKENIRKD
ncbi:MAG TPA: hypothetical protein DCY94_01280 [Firmicutes bacterium]|nr:hypothetical protein [Bacillota bacterium]